MARSDAVRTLRNHSSGEVQRWVADRGRRRGAKSTARARPPRSARSSASSTRTVTACLAEGDTVILHYRWLLLLPLLSLSVKMTVSPLARPAACARGGGDAGRRLPRAHGGSARGAAGAAYEGAAHHSALPFSAPDGRSPYESPVLGAKRLILSVPPRRRAARAARAGSCASPRSSIASGAPGAPMTMTAQAPG